MAADAPATSFPGLCVACRHAAVVRSKRSAFLRCGLADSDPRFARYPALPVSACSGFSAIVPTDPVRPAPAD